MTYNRKMLMLKAIHYNKKINMQGNLLVLMKVFIILNGDV